MKPLVTVGAAHGLEEIAKERQCFSGDDGRTDYPLGARIKHPRRQRANRLIREPAEDVFSMSIPSAPPYR